jgi:hypothetical protein
MRYRSQFADLKKDEAGGTTIALAMMTGLAGWCLYHCVSVPNLESAGAMAAYIAGDQVCAMHMPTNDVAAKGGRKFAFKAFSHDLVVEVSTRC